MAATGRRLARHLLHRHAVQPLHAGRQAVTQHGRRVARQAAERVGSAIAPKDNLAEVPKVAQLRGLAEILQLVALQLQRCEWVVGCRAAELTQRREAADAVVAQVERPE